MKAIKVELVVAAVGMFCVTCRGSARSNHDTASTDPQRDAANGAPSQEAVANGRDASVSAAASNPLPQAASQDERGPGAGCPSGTSYVPGGKYTRTALKGFIDVVALCVDRLEVTAADYDECMTRGSCPKLATPPEPGCNLRNAGRERHPMNCVPWRAADSYCHHRRARLPKYVELLWVAHGGPGAARFPWGDEEPSEAKVCWKRLDQNKDLGTCEVGSRSGDKSPQGIYDLAGNVSEWTIEHATEPSSMIVALGNYGTDDPRLLAQVSFSEGDKQNATTVGFRCVREAR